MIQARKALREPQARKAPPGQRVHKDLRAYRGMLGHKARKAPSDRWARKAHRA